MHFPQEFRRLLELSVGRLGPVFDADGKKAKGVGVVHVVADRDPAAVFRILENLKRGDVGLGYLIRAIGQRGVAPVDGDEIHLAVVGEPLHVAQTRNEPVPGLDFRCVDGFQKPRLAPFHDGLRAGMRRVGFESGTQLLKRLFLIAEVSEGRVIAVLFGVGLVELGILVARPIEYD